MKILQIEGTGCNLEGIAKSDGKIYFVPYALCGESVEVISSKQSSKFETVSKFQLLQKSHQRTEPKCKYYGCCGGCQIQHTNYKNELLLKQNLVKNNLKKFKIETDVKETVYCENQYNYRNKVTFFVSDGKLCLKDVNNQNIQIDRCEIIDENINKILPIIDEYLLSIKILNIFIKSVIIRYINNKYLILFVISKKLNFDFLIKILTKNKINFGLFYSINNKNNSNIPSSDYSLVQGIEDIEITENNIKYKINPYSFLQVNNSVKSKLYESVLNNISPNEVVADCYSGSGLLSAQICQKANWVYAIEIDKLASGICSQLAKVNKLKNLISINGDCSVEVPNLCKKEEISTIVLDPPRKGCERVVLESIINQNSVKKLIYISCNSATLGRDLQIILENSDFKIQSITPFDMFPKTANIETLVVLSK